VNPLWFFVGLEVGDRIRENLPAVKRTAKTAVRESYWFITGEIEKFRGGSVYRSWIDSLPTAEGGDAQRRTIG